MAELPNLSIRLKGPRIKKLQGKHLMCYFKLVKDVRRTRVSSLFFDKESEERHEKQFESIRPVCCVWSLGSR